MYYFDFEIDISDLSCPYPLVKTKEALNQLSKGKILKVITTDPASIIDFKVFSEISSHRLLNYEQNGATYCFWLEKDGKP